MARAPGGPAGGGMMPDPIGGGVGAGGDTMAGAGLDDMGADETVLVTIARNGDGTYTVYDGDESDSGVGGGADLSMADTAAMGAAGGAPASGAGGGGQPADSIGEALKMAMDILQADASSAGAPGSADDQFAAGFSASKTPTPATGPSTRR